MECTDRKSKQKLFKKIGALKKIKLPKKALEEIYYKTIISRVTYGISVWGNCSVPLFQRLEAIHARAARFIYNLPKELPDEKSLKRANWQPSSYIYKRRLSTIMHKFHHNTGDKSIQALFTRKARNQNQFNSIQNMEDIVSDTVGQLFGIPYHYI